MANDEDYAARLRALAGNKRCQFRYTRHAENELRNDAIAKLHVENMLRRCRVTLSEDSRGELTHRAEGTDVDGRPIAAVVVMYEEEIVIKVVTAWASKS